MAKTRRGFESVGDMVRSLGVVLAVVLVTVLITIRTHGQEVRVVNYTPTLTEAELTAQRMRASLAAASDQKAALSRFVGSLSAREARTLRAVLESSDRPHKT